MNKLLKVWLPVKNNFKFNIYILGCEVQKIFKIKKYNTLYTSLLSIVEESCSEINSNSEKHSIDGNIIIIIILVV
jgi:hypothetical protein